MIMIPSILSIFYLLSSYYLLWIAAETSDKTSSKKNGGYYSSYHCIGGSQVFKTESLHQASIKVFPLNDPEFRTCHYRNVCLINGEITYYQKYEEAHHVPNDYLPSGFDGNVHHLSYLRGFTMPVKTVIGSIPADSRFNPVDVVFLDANSWSFNYGHYILDNIIPTYMTYQLFKHTLRVYNDTSQEYTIPDYRDSQQLFETNCYQFGTLDLAYTHRIVTYNRSMGTYQQACLHRLETMYPYFLNHAPLYANLMKEQQDNRCFRHLITGQGSTFGLKSIDLSRGYFFQSFRDYVISRNKMIVPSQAENLILVGLRTVGSAGGSIINDLCELVHTAYDHIQHANWHNEQYIIQCFVPSDLSFEQEIFQVQRAKIIISVHGTISYMSLFAKDGTQQISIANPKELKENQMLLYATHVNLLYLTWDRLESLQGVLEHAITLSEAFYNL